MNRSERCRAFHNVPLLCDDGGIDLRRSLRGSLWTLTAVFLLAVGVLAPQLAYAQSAAAKGLQIAKAAREANRGYENFSAELEMTLRNKQGKESRRDLRIRSLEVANDGDRVLFVFDSPRNVKGTALLIHGHIAQADDQWLYLPALKRVKRISSSNRSGSFVGSEFAYEDLSSPEVEKCKYKYLKNEACGNLTCTVTEFVPATKGSGYTKQLVWHDTQELRVWKIEYCDRKRAHLKTLVHEDYKQFPGRIWRAQEMTMTNHITHKNTVLRWADYKFRTSLNTQDFTQTGLRRVR